MISLKDLPEELITKVKSLDSTHNRMTHLKIEKLFEQYGLSEELNNLRNTYQLTNIEIGKHILLDLEFEKHVCKTCGKHLVWNLKKMEFPIYCSAKCANTNPDKIQLTKENNIKKFGGVAPMCCEQIQNKAKNTCLKRYGVVVPSMLNTIKNKIKQTNLARYGYVNPVCNSVKRQEMIKRSRLKRREDSYTKLINALSEEIEPLFSKQDFLDKGTEYLYKWKCETCGREFDFYYQPNALPTCRQCHPYTLSSDQQELIDFIKTLIPYELKINDRTQIKPYELDIYIPELKLAFEFNGTYWHSENKGKPVDYHLNKTKLCEEKDIHLIHIFEWEWLFKKDLVKQRIRNVLGSNRSNKIFARKCEVREIASDIANEFVDKYHLQGISKASINLGLYHQNELVAVMTFAKPRFNKQYQWELIRFCSKYPIIGGAGKLLVYFEQKYKPRSIISYANRCWSSKLSNVYEKIGFKLIGESNPNYVWCKGDNVLSRYQCQKHKLKNLLGEENFDEKISETANMIKNGFKKVFDCGNLVFSKTYETI